ncbi:alpha/beta fold hydrolase [Geodermatophilus sp. SYSU D00079]
MTAEAATRDDAAAAAYYADGAVDAGAVRSAVARLEAPVLLVAGEYDVALPPARAAAYADLFGSAELSVQPGAGHTPWLDDPVAFARTAAAFLR